MSDHKNNNFSVLSFNFLCSDIDNSTPTSMSDNNNNNNKTLKKSDSNASGISNQVFNIVDEEKTSGEKQGSVRSKYKSDRLTNGHVGGKGTLNNKEANGEILRKRPGSRNMDNADTWSRRSSLVKSPGSIASSGKSRRLSTFAAHKYAQKFTEQQIAQLEKYSSLSYQPSHSELYQQWLKALPHVRFEVDRWFLLILSGICIGLVAVLLKQCLQFFDKIKWMAAKEFAQENDSLLYTWLCVWGIATIYILISSILVVFVHPPAVGSGVPDVIAYLNGILVHGVFSFKNLVVKFISLVFAVSSGIPTATQGPIIALGALIGRGIGQFKSKVFGCDPGWFSRFHNAEDRRAFTTAGVAAGVSAGFNAPIGGLLFAMEDLSSFWSKNLCWQTFFCSGIAAAVASVFNQAFNAFEYKGYFGLFRLSISEPIQIHVLSLVPAVILGVVGGLLGALFTRLNTIIVANRKKILAKIKHPKIQGVVRCLETCILVVIMVSVAVYLPQAFGCRRGEMYSNQTAGLVQCGWSIDSSREVYNCPIVNETEDYIYYNEVATLLQGSGTSFLTKLVTRGTYRWYSYGPLAAVLVIWYFITIYACGSAIAGGIFVPNLVSGALYGRILGLAMIDLYEILNEDYKWNLPLGDKTWMWLDPGVIAVIGAGSLLGGVTRLTLAVTVIVIEMSNDLDLTVPVLVAIWVAKLIADMLSKPLFKYQLDGKALPYLESDPVVPVNGHIVNLDLFKVSHVMSSPVLMIKSTESVYNLSSILLTTTHNSFPVVTYDQDTRTEHAVGLITRLELYVLLCHDDVYNEEKVGAVVTPNVDFEEISVDNLSDQSAARERIRMYCKFQLYHSVFVNLDLFINQSVPKIDQDYSLKRTYQQFQTLGMRHILVTDKKNRVKGVITRKDLMTFNLEHKLSKVMKEEDEELSDNASSVSGSFIAAVTVRQSKRLKHDSIIEETESQSHSLTSPISFIESTVMSAYPRDNTNL